MKQTLGRRNSKFSLKISTHFEFSFVSVDEIIKDIKKHNPYKATQSTYVPVKILRNYADIFADYICGLFNGIFKLLQISIHLTHANVTPSLKKVIVVIKKTIVQLLYYLQHQRFLKNYYVNKSLLLTNL